MPAYNSLVGGWAVTAPPGDPIGDPRLATTRTAERLIPDVGEGVTMPAPPVSERTELPVAAIVLAALAYLVILRMNGVKALVAVR